MNKKIFMFVFVMITILSMLTACAPAATPVPAEPAKPAAEEPTKPAGQEPAKPAAVGLAPDAVPTAQFVNDSVWKTQLEQMKTAPVNPDAKVYEQMIPPADLVDTAKFKKPGPWHFCFSNASVANTWRVTGFAAMQAEVKLHPEIGTFDVVDAQEKAEKQISDIEDLLTKKCDILIVSPTATEALTPAVEKAAAAGLPVVVFDRGVMTDKMVTFVTPVGGYAYGAAGAQWLMDKMGGKGNVLVLRVLPGVDALESRWAAAREIIGKYPDIKVLGVEFTQHDPAKAKAIVLDYLQRYGQIDGIYADFGGVGVAIYEAFKEAGAKFPPMTAEDYNGWLKVWAKNKDTVQSIAPTNPTYQWRTAIIAAVKIMKGEGVPKQWTLPEAVITNENLDQWVKPDLSDDLFVNNGSMDDPEFLKQFGGKESAQPPAAEPAKPAAGAVGLAPEAVPTAQFVNDSVWKTQLVQMKTAPVNPDAKVYEQMIPPADLVDTAKFKKPGPWHFCFSNASVANTWRVTGFAAMQAEVKLHPEIGTFDVVDAQEKAEKQISDIEDLLTKKCDILIVSPTATESLTPAVEKAAAAGLPVVVFDRGVMTDKMVTFVTPVGGYAYGAAGAQWLMDKMGGKGNVLVLRVLPGVDALESRWAAAREIIGKYPDIKVLGVEFTQHDPAKAKAIVLDYLQRYGQIDGIYADFGGVGVAIYEAFKEGGAKFPPMTAEDYNGWLKVWAKNKDTVQSIAPTNPTYQWRTAIIAAVKIMKGEGVPKQWTLPEAVITNENLDQWVKPDLSDDLFVNNGSMDDPEFLKQFGGK